MKTKIGHYDIVTELGRGGMGVVYKGHEPALNRYVAIKVLSPSLAHDESIKERFLREARSMAALNDPHIIQIYFIGEDDGQPFFAMEFVEGESISSYLKRESRMSPQASARVIYQTAQGLATAHDRGVIHRDIKPGNLMLDQRGRIKIADFGIALTSEPNKKLTSTGEFVGTPGYLSPEVCTGQRVDQRSDIFSLGIVLFELLAGRMPFTDESPLGLLLEVVRAEIPDVRQLNADVDAELTAILKRMTAKDPADRYQSCHELADDLAKHPLVSGANTITAKPQISAAAATVVGMKTPVSGQHQVEVQSARHVTPPPIHSAAGYATDAGNRAPTPPPVSAPQPAYVRPSVLESQDKRSSKSGGGWAVAAVIAIAAISGGTYAMRDRIPFLAGSDSNTVAGTTSTTTSATSPAITDASTAATGSAAGNVSGTASGSIGAATPPASSETALPVQQSVANDAAPADSNALGTAVAAAASGTEAAERAEARAREIGQPPTDAADTRVASNDAGADDRGPLLADQSNEPADIGPLRRLAESRKGALAKAAPPETRREPARPQAPGRVVVVAIGDPMITGPARQMVEETLENAGLLLADADTIPGVSDMADSGRADLPFLFRALQRADNVRAVAVIRAEPLGSQQLNYYGQSSTLYSVNLSVRGYDTASQSPLGSGFRTKVDFAQLNAEEKAREALEPELRRIGSALSRYRPRGSGG